MYALLPNSRFKLSPAIRLSPTLNRSLWDFFYNLFALVVSKVLYIFQRLASRHYSNILRIIFDLMYI